jgi:hypothetical protein
VSGEAIRWAQLFEEAGYTAVMPGWPDDPQTVEEAKAHPEVFARKGITEVADHFEEIIRGLEKSQERNEGLTEIVEIPGRGHALTIDSGWREVAQTALDFVKRFI